MAIVDPRYRVLCTLCNTFDNSFNIPRGALTTGAIKTNSFIEMPYDLHQIMVAHTAASFVVDYFDVLRYLECDDRGIMQHFNIPVLARYEFNLEERRTGSPKMSAIFTRAVDPICKTHSAWQSLSTQQQHKFEEMVRHRAEYEDFSEVRVKKEKATNNNSSKSFFYFIDTKGTVKASEWWSGIYPDELLKVRNELQKKFHMQLRDII
jgi:hypothetical protein